MTYAGYASPFSAIGAFGFASGEALSSLTSAARNSANRNAWGGAMTGRNPAKAARLARTAAQGAAIGAASTAMTVVGIGAASFMGTANILCNLRCSP